MKFLFFLKFSLGKMAQNLSSAAVVIGALRVDKAFFLNFLHAAFVTVS